VDGLRVFAVDGESGAASGLSPALALRRLVRGERPFLLDGAAPADGLGRYSYAGCDPTARLRIVEVPELGEADRQGEDGVYRVGQAGVRAPAAPVLRQIEQAVQAYLRAGGG
jgi:hypothetical protein